MKKTNLEILQDTVKSLNTKAKTSFVVIQVTERTFELKRSDKGGVIEKGAFLKIKNSLNVIKKVLK